MDRGPEEIQQATLNPEDRLIVENTANVHNDWNILGVPRGYASWADVANGSIITLDFDKWIVNSEENAADPSMKDKGVAVISLRGLEIGASEESESDIIAYLDAAWQSMGGDNYLGDYTFNALQLVVGKYGETATVYAEGAGGEAERTVYFWAGSWKTWTEAPSAKLRAEDGAYYEFRLAGDRLCMRSEQNQIPILSDMDRLFFISAKVGGVLCLTPSADQSDEAKAGVATSFDAGVATLSVTEMAVGGLTGYRLCHRQT